VPTPDLKKKKREPEATMSPTATPKASAEGSPPVEPDPKKAKKLEAEQKRQEKNQKELRAKMDELLTPEALGRLTKDKQYRASEFYIAVRKPKQTNKQTNKQTRLTYIDPERKQIDKRASGKTKRQTKQTISTNMSKSVGGLL
jgi:hypothetical protein